MKALIAAKGQEILVSDRDFSFLSNFRWHIDHHGYPYTRTVLTRLILSPTRKMVRDHKNRNKLDNRRSNLQVITHAQNVQRAPPSSKPKTSQFKGVSWHKSVGKWRACLSYRLNGGKQQIHLGHFNSETHAARAYDKAAKRRWGTFAYQNL